LESLSSIPDLNLSKRTHLAEEAAAAIGTGPGEWRAYLDLPLVSFADSQYLSGVAPFDAITLA
jgi:hypothetical protein